MSFFRRRIIAAALSTEPPDIPLIAFEDVQVQNSASRNRVTWQLTQASFIPAAFRIERKIAGGAWVEVESAYVMSDPFTGYKMGGINKNFYYIDDGLTTSGTYQYRINSTALSNIVTKTGTTYYVKTGGNNGSSGLTDALAWETMAYANPNANSTGDLVLFKRGDTWTEAQITFTNGGTSDNPVTWADYDSGNDPHLRLSTSGAYGFNLTNVAYRNFEFCKFSATLGVAAIIMFRSTNATRMCTGNKVMNCEVDVDNATTGAGGGIFMYHTANQVNDDVYQDTNYARTYHVEYPEISYCNIHSSALRSSIRSHDCRKGAWYHNNFVDGGSSGITVSGGDDHTVEYNEMKGGSYATHYGSGSKANSQIYWLNNMTYRRNLIYYMENYCLSLQSAKDALVEYNTCYDDGTTYANFYVFTDPDQGACSDYWAQGGNVIRNNIFMGGRDAQGAIRLDIYDLQTGGGNWYDHVDFYDNCIQEVSPGSIIELDNPSSKINTHSLFVSNWNDKYPDDIHDDPEFTDETAGDFTLQSGSPASNAGYTAAISSVAYYGEHIIPNGIFQQWSGNTPASWGVTGASGVFKNGNACQINTSGTSNVFRYGFTSGNDYYLEFDITNVTAGALVVRGSSSYETYTTIGPKTLRFTADSDAVYFENSGTTNITFTNAYIRLVQGTVLFKGNTGFEDGTWTNEWSAAAANGGDAAIAVDTGIVESGIYSLKFQHSTKGGDTYNRCEIVPVTTNNNQWWWKREYWYGARIYLKDWDTNPADWNTLIQIHSNPYNIDWGLGEAGYNGWTLFTNKSGYSGAPYNALRFHSQVLSETQALTETPPTWATGPHSWQIPVPENQWIYIVVNYKLSYQSDGFIKFYYNNQLVVNQSGPNIHYLDSQGSPKFQANNIQLGSYKQVDSTDERILYFDDIKRAGYQAIYADIAP